MDNEALALAITSIDTAEDSTSILWHTARQDYIAALTIKGASLAELRESNRRTDINHAVLEGFVDALPQPTATKTEGSPSLVRRFLGSRLIYLSGYTASFVTDNECVAGAIQRNVIWHMDRVIDNHGWTGGGEDSYWVSGFGRQCINPLYVIGMNGSQQALAVAFRDHRTSKNIKTSLSYKIDGEAIDREQSRAFIVELDKKQVKKLGQLSTERHTPPSPQAMLEMYDTTDQLLHIAHSHSDAIVATSTQFKSVRITDEVLLQFNVLDTITSMAQELDAVPALRQTLQKAITAL